MSYFTIKEIYEAALREESGGQPARTTLMFGDWYDAPPEGETDTRPDFIKLYADTWANTEGLPDDLIVRERGDWIFNDDFIDVEHALTAFRRTNVVYCMLHDTELKMIYKALTTDFNPLENYDRYEELKRKSRGKSEASNTSGSKTSPDFVASGTTFYDTAQMDGLSEGKSRAEEMANNHIHGNIGITQATDMINNAVTYFTKNSAYDAIINKLLDDCTILIV